jgi:hypothetical protein
MKDMSDVKLKEKALQFIWDKGYGRETNLTLNSVAYLMVEFIKEQLLNELNNQNK